MGKKNLDLEAMAKDHAKGLSIMKIGEKYGVAQGTVASRLKEYSAISSWYDYEKTKARNRESIRLQSELDTQHPANGGDIIKSIYATFILLKMEEGLTEAQAWDEIHSFWKNYQQKENERENSKEKENEEGVDTV